MTVRKLTDAKKKAVVTIYTSTMKPKTIREMAVLLSVSIRTVGRVIEEAGFVASKKTAAPDNVKTTAKAKEVIKFGAEIHQVMALLYKHKINAGQLEALLSRMPADTIELLCQKRASRKSPSGHNGKQTLLPLNFPISLELH